MKKILASVLAFMAVTAVFTSCGDDEPESSISSSVSESSQADESSESSEETTTSETTTEAETTTTTTTEKADTTEEATTSAETTETTTEASADSGNNNSEVLTGAEIENADEYITAITNLFDAMTERDLNKCLEMSMPESTFKAMKETHMLDFMIEAVETTGDIFDDVDEFEDVDISSIEVVSVRTADPEYLKAAEIQYSTFEGICNCLIDAGLTYDILMSDEMPEDMTANELTALMEKLSVYTDGTQDIEITVDFETYDMVTYKAGNETVEYPVFRTSGGTPKIDLMMLGYMDDSDDMGEWDTTED